jgi:hypothetical protein
MKTLLEEVKKGGADEPDEDDVGDPKGDSHEGEVRFSYDLSRTSDGARSSTYEAISRTIDDVDWIYEKEESQQSNRVIAPSDSGTSIQSFWFKFYDRLREFRSTDDFSFYRSDLSGVGHINVSLQTGERSLPENDPFSDSAVSE